MDGFMKLLISIVVMVVVYLLVQKIKADKAVKKKASQIPACEELTETAFYQFKKDHRDAIANEFSQLPGDKKTTVMFRWIDQYREEAIKAGTNNNGQDIFQYALWAMAHKRMLSDGYCPKEV